MCIRDSMKEYAVDYFEDAPLLDACNCSSCVKDQIVLRLSFGMFISFAILAIVVLVVPDCCAEPVYYGMWFPKFAMTATLCAGSFLLPNDFFQEYVYFSAIVSGLFILLQVLVLLEWAYSWNETWRGDEPPEECTGWRVALLIFSGVLIGGALTLAGFMYDWFDCALGYSMTSLSMIVMLVLTCLSITSWCEHGSLIASAVVFFNVQLVTAQGLYYNSDASCNGLASQDGGNDVQVALSFLLAAVGITKAAWASINNSDKAGGIDVTMSAIPGPKPAAASGDGTMPDDGAWRYMGILAVSMCYMGMLLSDWGVKIGNNCSEDDTKSDIGLWVNLATSWLAMMLYFWSLIAPKVLTGRDFGRKPKSKSKSKSAGEFQY
eukprot:TRINITY_DN19308_c0_g1_i1.p1 TRINITY_DN19308_c0_g1~~TRINITY_DN19308_c0_g1_i1.p1  ORF type:complete len:377 (+),score=69.70 TRINITY_DN19308_c0_g1_i1:137-1267(+)